MLKNEEQSPFYIQADRMFFFCRRRLILFLSNGLTLSLRGGFFFFYRRICFILDFCFYVSLVLPGGVGGVREFLFLCYIRRCSLDSIFPGKQDLNAASLSEEDLLNLSDEQLDELLEKTG